MAVGDPVGLEVGDPVGLPVGGNVGGDVGDGVVDSAWAGITAVSIIGRDHFPGT